MKFVYHQLNWQSSNILLVFSEDPLHIKAQPSWFTVFTYLTEFNRCTTHQKIPRIQLPTTYKSYTHTAQTTEVEEQLTGHKQRMFEVACF